MKKLFIIINSLNGGGAERVASILSQALITDYQIVIISLEKKQENSYFFSGNKIYLNTKTATSFLFRTIDATNKLNKVIKQERPDLILSFLNNACLVTMLSRHKGIKTILSVRNYLKLQYTGKKLYIWEQIYKRKFSKADMIVSVSDEISNLLIEDYHFQKEKCKTIYNPCDINFITSKCKDSLSEIYINKTRNHKVIATLGHIGQQKAMERLIDILPSILVEEPTALLVIIGSTDNQKYYDTLKYRSSKKGVLNSIYFIGTQQNPFKYLYQADVYCLSSRFEGFPNALTEAMACGLPVVATDCHSGPREILATSYSDITYQETDYGILVNGNDTISGSDGMTELERNIEQGILRLLKNPELNKKYRQQSIRRVKDFSVNKIVSEWKDLIKEIAK
jgi:glycosyltransferase involved in cell wall biosynthesis